MGILNPWRNHEYGQGTLTVMMQIVASEIGLRYDQVKLSFTDTATSPKTGPTTASRQTFIWKCDDFGKP